jgi:hypothetical protein
MSLSQTVTLTYQEIYILRSFTQFEARIYEQSLIKEILPNLNNSLTVNFPFLNWKEVDTDLTFKEESDRYLITVSKEKSFIMSFSSINAVVRALSILNTTLNRYVNYINISL